MILKTSGGVTIDSWEDVPFVGTSTGDIARTVSGNGRILLTGSGGAHLWQVGDPSPDNVGGTLTIEGWAGTQADSITLDAATVTTTGLVKPNGKKISSTVYTEPTTFTATSNVDITLPNTPSGIRGYRVRLFDMFSSAATVPVLRFSYDGGSTYKSGGTDYGYSYLSSNTSGAPGTPFSAYAATASSILAYNINSVANRPILMWFEIFTPNSGSYDTILDGRIISPQDTSTAPTIQTVAGYGRNAYGRATNFRLNFGAQTVSGLYTVETLFGTGDA